MLPLPRRGSPCPMLTPIIGRASSTPGCRLAMRLESGAWLVLATLLSNGQLLFGSVASTGHRHLRAGSDLVRPADARQDLLHVRETDSGRLRPAAAAG